MDVIVADDMISSGDSMIDVCRQLKSLKAGNLDTTFYMYTGEEKAKSHKADTQKSSKSKYRGEKNGNRSRTR